MLINVWKVGKKWAEISRRLKTRNENDVKNRYLSFEKIYLNHQTKYCQMKTENQKSKISNILKQFLFNNPNLKTWLDLNLNENLGFLDFDNFTQNLLINYNLCYENENFWIDSEKI